jgi:hypothetical protein
MKKQLLTLYNLLQGRTRKVAWTIAPSVVVILMAFLISGCVKQKDCDCGAIGTFVYLKEPYQMRTICVKKEKVVAEITADGGHVSLITGYVPRKFQSGDSIRVRWCGEFVCKNGGTTEALPMVFTLKCLERE